MPRLPKALREAFPAAKTLYDVLGCAATATEAELKKAYYRAALRHHPDKAGQGEGATARFQALSLAHSVLSDPARRQEYDETGEVEEGGGGGGGAGGGGGEGSFASGYAHWRAMFPAFTTADIDAFAQRYRGSAEEVEDVLAAYAERRGDMDAVLDSVPCSRDDDDARFAAMVHAAIADGRAKPLRAFVALYGSKAAAAAAAAAPGAAAAGGKEGGGEVEEDEEDEEDEEEEDEEEEEEEEAGAGASAAAAARKGRKGFWKRGSAGGGGAAAAAPRAAAAAAASGGSAHKLAASRAARSARAAAEAAEAEELLAKMQKAHAKKTGGTVGEASLEAMIRARAEERNKGMGGFLADLESKYGGSGKGGGGKKASAGALEDAKPAAKRGKK